MMTASHLPARSDRCLPSLAWIGFFAVPCAAVLGLAPPRLALLLIVAPVLEEVVFRLGLQQAVYRRFGSGAVAAVTAIGFTAVAFTCAHVLLNPTPWAVWTLLPALINGVAYHKTWQVSYCIALHALFNLIWLASPRLSLS